MHHFRCRCCVCRQPTCSQKREPLCRKRIARKVTQVSRSSNEQRRANNAIPVGLRLPHVDTPNAVGHCQRERDAVEVLPVIRCDAGSNTSGSEGRHAAAVPIATDAPSTGRPSRYCTVAQAAATATRLKAACSVAQAMVLSLNHWFTRSDAKKSASVFAIGLDGREQEAT